MKVLWVIVLVVVLLVAFAAPIFADKDGVPNDNADFGQVVKALEDVSATVHEGQDIAEDLGMNLGQLIKIIK